MSNPEVRWTVGVVDSAEIDRINILRASHRAMRLAITALIDPPGSRLDRWTARHSFSASADRASSTAIASVLSIAAASVIAKVTRDRMMRDFCAQFPQYCFGQHKGYGTELHLAETP